MADFHNHGQWTVPCRLILASLSILLLIAATESAADCPSLDINEIADSQLVQDSMREYWERSQPGTPDAHEEGFWILQCRQPTVSGGWIYSTQILGEAPGDVDTIAFGPNPQRENCRTVGTFHTHPGRSSYSPQNDGYENQRPSQDDRAWANTEGVPGIIVYGGWWGSRQEIVHPANQRNEATNPSWRCPEEEEEEEEEEHPTGESAVDPHLRTIDGLRYDFQAAGEFIALATPSEDLLIQVRQEPYGASTKVTINTAIAVRLGDDTVGFYLDPPHLFVNGEPIPDRQQFVSLIGGGSLTVDNREKRYTLRSASGDLVRVLRRSVMINFYVRPSPHRHGRVAGLLGNFDGDDSNEFVTRGGELVDLISGDQRAALYEIFGESWRIRDRESLFVYPPRGSTADFTRREIPDILTSAGDLSSADRARAQIVCEEAGIPAGPDLENCILDVGLTGEELFATALAEFLDDRRRYATSKLVQLNHVVEDVIRPLKSKHYLIEMLAGDYRFEIDKEGSVRVRLDDPDGRTVKIFAQSDQLLLSKSGLYLFSVTVPDGQQAQFFAERDNSPYAFVVLPMAWVPVTLFDLGDAVQGSFVRLNEARLLKERRYSIDLKPGDYRFEIDADNPVRVSLEDPDRRIIKIFVTSGLVSLTKPGRYTLRVAIAKNFQARRNILEDSATFEFRVTSQ